MLGRTWANNFDFWFILISLIPWFYNFHCNLAFPMVAYPCRAAGPMTPEPCVPEPISLNSRTQITSGSIFLLDFWFILMLTFIEFVIFWLWWISTFLITTGIPVRRDPWGIWFLIHSDFLTFLTFLILWLFNSSGDASGGRLFFYFGPKTDLRWGGLTSQTHCNILMDPQE